MPDDKAEFLNSYAYNADQQLTMVLQQQQTGGNTVAPKELDYGYNAIGQFTSGQLPRNSTMATTPSANSPLGS